MPQAVTVYRTESCPYCVLAKRLLQKKAIAFEEVYLDRDPVRLQELKERLDWRTVPMIFVGETFVGGYSDLKALDDAGGLDKLVSAP